MGIYRNKGQINDNFYVDLFLQFLGSTSPFLDDKGIAYSPFLHIKEKEVLSSNIEHQFAKTFFASRFSLVRIWFKFSCFCFLPVIVSYECVPCIVQQQPFQSFSYLVIVCFICFEFLHHFVCHSLLQLSWRVSEAGFVSQKENLIILLIRKIGV